jgi:YVTN family beta-propeller protein
MLRRISLLALAAVALRAPARATVTAFVANTFDGTVSIVDVPTGTPRATVTVGCGPRDVVAHPDGSRVYVANTCEGDLDALPGSVSVIDTTTNTVVATVPVPFGPVALAIDARRHRLYAACLVEVPFSDEDPGGVLFVADLDTGAPVDQLPLFLVPRDLVLTRGGSRAFVSGDVGFRDDEDVVHRTGVVTDVALDGGTDTPVYRGAGGPMAIDPRDRTLYVVDYATDELVVVDAATAAEIARVPVGVAAQDVLFDRRGQRVFVTSAGASPNALPDSVIVVGARTNAVLGTFDGGWAPVGMARIARGRTLLVTNFYAGELLVMNARTGVVRRTIPVGAGADAVAVVEHGGWSGRARGPAR